MQAVSYWEAWTLWWSGAKTDNTVLLGWPMLYWGRSGKCLQYLSGLIILIDLVGPSRLSKLATRVATRTKRASDTAKRPSSRYIPLFTGILFLAAVSSSVYFIAFVRGEEYSDSPLIKLSIILAIPLIVFYVIWHLLMIADKIVRPAVWVMEAGKSTHPARWVAFMVFTIGFQFDLLAS